MYTIEPETGRTDLTKLILNPDLDLKSERIIDVVFLILLFLLYSLHNIRVEIWEWKTVWILPNWLALRMTYDVWWMQLKIKRVKSILNRTQQPTLQPCVVCRVQFVIRIFYIVGNSVICQYIHVTYVFEIRKPIEFTNIWNEGHTHTHILHG